MNCESGFNALPNELFLLIGDEISDDPRTLKALALVSKRCHDSFDSFLYRDVGNKALPTLALSKKSRLPFTGTHPASYVKKLSVSPIHKLSATVFQKQMVSAMKNIALHAANGAIQSFTFCSNFSLPEAFGGNVPHALRLLEELVLNCPFPVKNTRLSLSLANSLCGPSLIALDLKFCYPLQSPPDYSTIAKLIKQLPTSSPGLKRLSLQIGYSRHRPDTFAKVLSDSTFTFPFLREFGLEVNDVYGKLSDSLTAFFQHHPMIEVLKYRVHTSTSSARPLATPGIFRKLRHLESFAEDGILLCNLGTCWLEYLALDFYLSRPQSERYLQVRDALSKTASIRQLNLRKQDGYNLDNVSSIISACPNLTHLECRLDLVSSKRCNINLIYSTILGMLPHLVYLRPNVQIWQSWNPFSEGMHSGLSKEAWSTMLAKEHREAITAVIPLTDHSADTLRIEVYSVEDFSDKVLPLIVYLYYVN